MLASAAFGVAALDTPEGRRQLHELFARQAREMLDQTDLDEEQLTNWGGYRGEKPVPTR